MKGVWDAFSKRSSGQAQQSLRIQSYAWGGLALSGTAVAYTLHQNNKQAKLRKQQQQQQQQQEEKGGE